LRTTLVTQFEVDSLALNGLPVGTYKLNGNFTVGVVAEFEKARAVIIAGLYTDESSLDIGRPFVILRILLFGEIRGTGGERHPS
jgi:hypothetical protein